MDVAKVAVCPSAIAQDKLATAAEVATAADQQKIIRHR